MCLAQGPQLSDACEARTRGLSVSSQALSSADPEGGTGGPDPPGKSQVIWVSIGNKQLDPPWKKLDPPGKCWTPSGTLKNDRFL